MTEHNDRILQLKVTDGNDRSKRLIKRQMKMTDGNDRIGSICLEKCRYTIPPHLGSWRASIPHIRQLESQYPSFRQLESQYPSYPAAGELISFFYPTQQQYKGYIFEISDVLFCEPESQKFRKCTCWYSRRFVLRIGVSQFLKVHLLRCPRFCSADRSPRILESALFWDFRRVVLRTGVPEILKVHCLRFPTFCSAQESQNSWKSMLWDFWRFVLRTGVP